MLETASLVLTLVFVVAASAISLYILVRMWREQGPIHAVLGFIFVPYAYIWGWLNASRLKIVDVMLFWTFVTIGSIGFPLAMGFVTGAQAIAESPILSEDVGPAFVSDDVRAQGSIAPGMQVQGSLDDIFAIDEWTLSGQAGQTISIDCEPAPGSDTDPRISVLAPSGAAVAIDDDGGTGFAASVQNLTLPESGTYLIQIDVFTPGPYLLRVR